MTESAGNPDATPTTLKDAVRIIGQQAEENAGLRGEIDRQRQQIARLTEMVKRFQRAQFGARTERMVHDPGQQELDLGDAAGADATPLIDEDAVPDVPAVPKTKRSRGRPQLSVAYPDLPVVAEPLIELPPADRFDSDGRPLVAMGVESTELLVVPQPQPYIRLIRRVRYGRSDTAEKVCTAPLPPRIVRRGMLDDLTVHNAVVQHYEDCLPWHRQERIWKRMGIGIARNTLCDAAAAWGDWAAPLSRAIKDAVLTGDVVMADSSFIRMQDRSLHRRCRQTAMWAATDGAQVFYRWTDNLQYDRAPELLDGFTGYLVRDEWKGWSRAATSGIIPVGCSAHGRRPFALWQDEDRYAKLMVALYAALYRVEALAKESGLTGEALFAHRLALRQKHSRRIMKRIRALAERIQTLYTPGTDLFKAARYLIRYWENLTRFLDNGALPADNNLAENVLRQVALLRKNRLFLGSVKGGETMAIALTVLRSCRMQELDHVAYLQAVTPVLHAYQQAAEREGDLPDLAAWTPAAYAQRVHGSQRQVA